MTPHRTIAAVAAAFAVMAAPAVAQEETDTATLEKGGTTKLTLSKKAASVLKEAGTSLSTKKFGIASGRIDPVDGKPADVVHSGKLTFRAGSSKITFKRLDLELGGKGKLFGQTGGKVIVLANLTGGNAVRQQLESTDVTGVKASLSRAAAKALNHALETGAFKKGLVLGKLSVDAQLAEALVAPTGQTSLQVPLDFATKLTAQGIQAAPIAPATASAGQGGLPVYGFPIDGGKAKSDLSEMTVEHTGGLTLSKGSVALPLAQPALEIKTPPELTVSLGGARAAAADLDLSGMVRTQTANGVDLSGIVVKLNTTSAGVLNAAFQTNVFAAGETIGTLSTSVTFL